MIHKVMRMLSTNKLLLKPIIRGGYDKTGSLEKRARERALSSRLRVVYLFFSNEELLTQQFGYTTFREETGLKWFQILLANKLDLLT